WDSDGLLFRLMANDASVRSIGSWLSYVTAATFPVADRSRNVIDLMRSLMSCSGNERSTRASPSISPLRVKWPTPELNRITCEIGRLTAGFRSAALAGSFPAAGDGADSPRWARKTPTAARRARAAAGRPERTGRERGMGVLPAA